MTDYRNPSAWGTIEITQVDIGENDYKLTFAWDGPPVTGVSIEFIKASNPDLVKVFPSLKLKGWGPIVGVGDCIRIGPYGLAVEDILFIPGVLICRKIDEAKWPVKDQGGG